MKYLIIFAALSVGALLLLGCNPLSGSRRLLAKSKDYLPPMPTRRPTLKELREELLGLKKTTAAKRLVGEVSRVLALEGRASAIRRVKAVSCLCAALGLVVGAIMRNVFIMPVLAAAGWFVPLWIIKSRNGSYQARIAADLEAALAVITSSYLRQPDIVLAVEENLSYLQEPVAAPFRTFVVNTRLVSADVSAALLRLRGSFPNDVFQRWCDVLIQCQDNVLMQAMLQPTLQSFADLREIQAEYDTEVSFVRKDTITLCIGVLAALLIFCSVSAWFRVLYTTTVGKGILAGVVLAVLFAINKTIDLTEPLTFKGVKKK